METTKVNLAVESEISIINTLIANYSQVKIETIYKKTEKWFRRVYGIKSETAPSFMVKNDMIYKLSYASWKSKVTSKRMREYLEYTPVARARGKFTEYTL